ncbi:MAG: TraR/DksA family transcriptional regulator [Planctomycetota bacterium]|jgi:predicted RNA-binding Zn-ribbon protein involved in translation (DUF1610 family)
MTRHTQYVDLRCRRCSWAEVCGPEANAGWLRKAGKLRAGVDPEPEVMVEVLRAAAGKLACPECGHVGLAALPAEEDRLDWSEPQTCASCGRPIPAERLEALPEATLCAACRQDEELGRAKTEIDYCPRCGAPMQLRPTAAGGVTRYVLTCTGVPPCRR